MEKYANGSFQSSFPHFLSHFSSASKFFISLHYHLFSRVHKHPDRHSANSFMYSIHYFSRNKHRQRMCFQSVKFMIQQIIYMHAKWNEQVPAVYSLNTKLIELLPSLYPHDMSEILFFVWNWIHLYRRWRLNFCVLFGTLLMIVYENSLIFNTCQVIRQQFIPDRADMTLIFWQVAIDF